MLGGRALRRSTERNRKIVNFYLYLAAVLLTVRRLPTSPHALPVGHLSDCPAPEVIPIAGRC